MATGLVIRTFIEVFTILLVVFAVMHERDLIRFEDKIFAFIAKKIYIYKRRKAIEKKREIKRLQSQRKAEYNNKFQKAA